MENKHQVLVLDRLQKNHSDFVSGWSALNPSELIEKAEEIYAPTLDQGVTMC